MGNKYLEKVAELQEVEMMEKQAFDPITMTAAGNFLAHLGGVHVAQNVITKGALHTPMFAKSTAEHFHAGLHGKVAPAMNNGGINVGNVMSTGVGALNPELNIIRDEAYHAGHLARQHFTERGLDPANLPKRAKLALHLASSGEFNALTKHTHDPHVRMALDAMSQTTGHPLLKILGGNKEGIDAAEKAWKSSPISNNIIRRIGKSDVNVSHLPDGHSGNNVGQSLVGSMLMATQGDAITGGLGVMKAGLASERVSNAIPGAKWLGDKLKKRFVTNPIDKNMQMGLQGQSRSRAVREFQRFGQSAPVGETGHLGNQMGQAHHEAVFKYPAPEPVITQAHINDRAHALAADRALAQAKSNSKAQSVLQAQKQSKAQAPAQAPAPRSRRTAIRSSCLILAPLFPARGIRAIRVTGFG